MDLFVAGRREPVKAEIKGDCVVLSAQVDMGLFGNLAWLSEQDCDIGKLLLTKIKMKGMCTFGYEGGKY